MLFFLRAWGLRHQRDAVDVEVDDLILLYGVNAGGCGTPLASLANLIGADLYQRGRLVRRPFWGLFSVVSGALLAVSVAWSLILLRATP